MNEDPKFQQTGYWRKENIGQCYLDMLEDLANCLELRYIRNYFNEKENILDGKNSYVLDALKREVLARHKKLQHVQLTD